MLFGENPNPPWPVQQLPLCWIENRKRKDDRYVLCRINNRHVAGGMISAVLICVVIAGGRAERSMEYEDMETGYRTAEAGQAGKGESGKSIRFVDIFDHELFCIEDGE